MNNNFARIYNKKNLEDVSDFAWENKTDIVIYYQGERFSYGYIGSDNYDKESLFVKQANFYIRINDFKTQDELNAYIACCVIGG